MQAGEFQRHPLGDDALFPAGVDEQQLFLPVLEKAEIAARIAPLQWRLRRADAGLALAALLLMPAGAAANLPGLADFDRALTSLENWPGLSSLALTLGLTAATVYLFSNDEEESDDETVTGVSRWF